MKHFYKDRTIEISSGENPDGNWTVTAEIWEKTPLGRAMPVGWKMQRDFKTREDAEAAGLEWATNEINDRALGQYD